MLFRLIYVSRPADGVDLRETRKILSVSQENNVRRAISGTLIFNSGYFLQWLEGSRTEVSSLYSHIAKDPRHRDAELLEFSQVARREFAEWSMGYVGEGVLNQALFYRYSPRAVFDPYALDGPAAVEFMRDAAASALRLSKPQSSAA